MKVFIITEGYQSTGYGHITRCLSIYQAFVEKNITPLLIINGDAEAEHFLHNSNYELINWTENLELLYEKVAGSHLVIIDSYKADSKVYNEIYNRTKCLVAVDDFIRLDYNAHIVLNGTIGSEFFSYNRKNIAKFLLGAKYIPLRNDFCNVPEKVISKNIANILITMGGQDVRSLTQPLLDSLLRIFPQFKFYVVARDSFNIIIDKYAPFKNIEFIFNADAARMKELMLKCDVAISAAGQTLYELARIGLPTIAIIVADNQIRNLQGWIKNGFILEELNFTDDSLLPKIKNEIYRLADISLRQEICKQGRETIDGKGAERIVDELLKHTNCMNG